MFERNIFYLIEREAVSEVFHCVTDAEMIKIFIFLFLLRTGHFTFVPENHKNWNLLSHDNCGQVSTKRIIGGEVAHLSAYPWLVRIGYGMENVETTFFLCGGSLVNPTTVLTAAHCAENGGLEVRVIRLGEHNVETDPDCEDGHCADPIIDVQVSNMVVHSGYDGTLFKNDIAIMQLKEKVKFSASVKPICIGGSDFMGKSFIGSMGEVAGWGIYDIDTGLTSNILEYVRVPVIDTKKCLKHYGHYVTAEKQLCAGGKIGQDSCSGDSGGPLMIVDDGPVGPSYFLLGIVSFGPTKCGATDVPGVYTNTSYYLEWFLDNLNSSSKAE